MLPVNLAMLLLVACAWPLTAQSRTCHYLVGARAGTTRALPSRATLALGAACGDSRGSRGIATPDGVRAPRGAFTESPPACTDIIGAAVSIEAVTAGVIAKTGFATMVDGRPVIRIRSEELRQFPAAVQSFLLAHECGHHALGQVRGDFVLGLTPGAEAEARADCFALRSLGALGAIDRAGEAAVFDFLRALPADAANDPGPVRARRLGRCGARGARSDAGRRSTQPSR